MERVMVLTVKGVDGMVKSKSRDLLLSLSIAVFALLFILQAVYGQPQPCYVNGKVCYDSGGCCGNGECTCNITNSSKLTIGTASTNASGHYWDTVNVLTYNENITVNCTGLGYWGYNYNNCTGGKASINITILVPEYSDVEQGGVSFPGYLIPILISASLCVAFIRGED
ncbi:MAG: hypothetical protein ABH834_06400 [Candidatus Altiarchaeota archaeon]